jgi:hypothetical protein
MSGHTPGPWTVELVHDGMHWHVGADFVVAECPAGAPAWDANARLIGAAPDLYDSLIEALATMGFLRSCIRSGESLSEGDEATYQRTIAKVQASIRKVEGREP